MSEWSVYVLRSTVANRTYVGYTRTGKILSRLAQHNGLKAGGAKATRSGRPHEIVASVDGLEKRPAMQLEWRMHRRYSGPKGIQGRLGQLCKALSMERWTSTAPPTDSLTELRVSWHSSSLEEPLELKKWIK